MFCSIPRRVLTFESWLPHRQYSSQGLEVRLLNFYCPHSKKIPLLVSLLLLFWSLLKCTVCGVVGIILKVKDSGVLMGLYGHFIKIEALTFFQGFCGYR